ncbi:hypothetical protein EV421DRAFT_1451382 [Armillaria borealis]|uniref:Uncharacterized protein n=1 Tax=Armillaria borealis TaxID=47425 RepID=A0AA39MGG4_9AGAR|nr:hypothetical protein EV421DRAFT_1451382 [Armillaria borealis]
MFGIPARCGYSLSRGRIKLARRDNLRSLALPSSDLHFRILRHHSTFGLCHNEFGNPHLSRQADAKLLTWLDGQTNVVSVRFQFLLDDDDSASPASPLPATPSCILSVPTTSSGLHFPRLRCRRPAYSSANSRYVHAHRRHTAPQSYDHPRPDTSCHPPCAASASNYSTLIYAGFCPTTTLKSHPPSARRLRFTFKSLRKRKEEKTLCSAIVVCPAIEELEVEGEGGEERWCSIVPQFKSLRSLVMRKPWTAQVKIAMEELDERFPHPK